MSSKTTNYNLHKIDLTDAPPDITVLNQNWDTIDNELKSRLPLDGSVAMTGDLKLGNGTGHLGSNQGLTIFSHNNADKTPSYIAIYENTNNVGNTLQYIVKGGEYNVFGEHNLDLMKQQLSAVATAAVG